MKRMLNPILKTIFERKNIRKVKPVKNLEGND